jgi:serine/threonine protein kinase
VKFPNDPNDTAESMDEVHLINAIYDHTDNRIFVTQVKEELIVQKEGTEEVLFYCAFYERVKTEIHQVFPDTASQKEFRDAVGELLIYFHQGIQFIMGLHKINIYFGDFKPENLLVTFSGKELKIGDLGVA